MKEYDWKDELEWNGLMYDRVKGTRKEVKGSGRKRGAYSDWDDIERSPACRNKSEGHMPTTVLREKGVWELDVGSRPEVRGHVIEYGMVLNLTGDSVFRQHGHIIPERFPLLFKYNGGDKKEMGWEKEVLIDWPNYGVPNLHFSFWTDLAKVIKGIGKTLMFCQGGHGRTGTAVAVMMLATGVFRKGDEAIVWVREKYCPRAIESRSQEEMVKEFARWVKR